jgi:hypothetical protein
MSDTLYSARFRGPTLIEINKAQTVSLDVEKDGSAASITSGTFYVYDEGGNVIINAQVASVSSGTISGTIAASDTSGKTLGPSWLVRFDAVIGGKTYRFNNDACLCVARLYPPIGQTDLVNRHSDVANLLASGVTSCQQYIDDAWSDITNRMYSEQSYFWRLRTPSAFRNVMFARSLTLIFRDYATLLNAGDRYMQLSEYYEQQYERAYSKLRSRIDQDEDNQLSNRQQSIPAVTYLTPLSYRRNRSRRNY